MFDGVCRRAFFLPKNGKGIYDRIGFTCRRGGPEWTFQLSLAGSLASRMFGLQDFLDPALTQINAFLQHVHASEGVVGQDFGQNHGLGHGVVPVHIQERVPVPLAGQGQYHNVPLSGAAPQHQGQIQRKIPRRDGAGVHGRLFARSRENIPLVEGDGGTPIRTLPASFTGQFHTDFEIDLQAAGPAFQHQQTHTMLADKMAEELMKFPRLMHAVQGENAIEQQRYMGRIQPVGLVFGHSRLNLGFWSLHLLPTLNTRIILGAF